jgi:hypothetical protein
VPLVSTYYSLVTYLPTYFRSQRRLAGCSTCWPTRDVFLHYSDHFIVVNGNHSLCTVNAGVLCGRTLSSISGMADRLRQCKPGKSFAKSVSEGKAKQLIGFGERLPWDELSRLTGIQNLESRCSRVAFIVRA